MAAGNQLAAWSQTGALPKLFFVGPYASNLDSLRHYLVSRLARVSFGRVMFEGET